MPAAIRRAASRVNKFREGSAGNSFPVIDEYQRSIVAGLCDKTAADVFDTHGGGKRRPVTNLFDLPDSSQRCRSVPFPGLDLVRIIDSRWLARGEPLLAVWLDPHVSSLELRRGSGFGAQGSPKRW